MCDWGGVEKRRVPRASLRAHAAGGGAGLHRTAATTERREEAELVTALLARAVPLGERSTFPTTNYKA